MAPELIAALLTDGCTFRYTETWVTEGLPAGAQLVGVAYSAGERAWAFDFVHPSFEEVAEGGIPPELVPTFTRHTFDYDLAEH